MSAKESVEAMRKQIKAKQDELAEQVRLLFQQEAKSVFDAVPGLEVFRWAQYTPYFNDGDACEFSSHYDSAELKFAGGEYADEYDAKDERESAYRTVGKFLANFNDDDFESMFGDHCQVTVARDGVSVEEYEHD